MKIIVIDFDGTIVENNWPEIGKPIPGAVWTIRALHAQGHRIIISTCRAGKPEQDARDWLICNQVPFDSFNENLPEQISRYGSDCRKMSGDVYIDDRNFGGLPDWSHIHRVLVEGAAHE